MKESIRKFVRTLRPEKSSALRIAAEPVPPKKAWSLPGSKTRIRRRAKSDVTGQTVFGDRSSRFRNLVLSDVDAPSLEEAAAIPGAFKIRLAKRTGARRDATALVEARYESRGYTIASRKPSPNVFTFIAYDEGLVVGTVGLGVDSAGGLSADELYGEEMRALRAKGCRVCEFTRLAVDRTAASKPVLAGLFQTAYLYAAIIRGYTHAVIEVNPRHVTFYIKSLKFEVVGPVRLNQRVNAPAVLLCASFAAIAEGLAQHAGKMPPPGTRRTIFHYGFPPDEERGVLTRLHQLVDTKLTE